MCGAVTVCMRSISCMLRRAGSVFSEGWMTKDRYACYQRCGTIGIRSCTYPLCFHEINLIQPIMRTGSKIKLRAMKLTVVVVNNVLGYFDDKVVRLKLDRITTGSSGGTTHTYGLNKAARDAGSIDWWCTFVKRAATRRTTATSTTSTTSRSNSGGHGVRLWKSRVYS